MPEFYVAFSGGLWIKAQSEEEALETFSAETSGDELLDAIEETVVQ